MVRASPPNLDRPLNRHPSDSRTLWEDFRTDADVAGVRLKLDCEKNVIVRPLQIRLNVLSGQGRHHRSALHQSDGRGGGDKTGSPRDIPLWAASCPAAGPLQSAAPIPPRPRPSKSHIHFLRPSLKYTPCNQALTDLSFHDYRKPQHGHTVA
jgi:hypothetical protein